MHNHQSWHMIYWLSMKGQAAANFDASVNINITLRKCMQCVILQPHTIPLGPAGPGTKHTNSSHLFTRSNHFHFLLSLPGSRAFCTFRKPWQVIRLSLEEAGMEKEGRNLSFLGKLKGEVNNPLNVSADSLRAIADWDPDILARY